MSIDITKMLAKCRMGWMRHGPKILTIAGIITGTAATITACVATTKLAPIMEEHKNNMGKLNETTEQNAEAGSKKRDILNERIRTGVKIVKLYAPAAGMYVVSVLEIIGAHNMLTEQKAQLAAAYLALDSGYKTYRQRVIDRYGKDADFELRNDIHDEEIEETVTDENGNTTTSTKTIKVSGAHSEYARYFTNKESSSAEQSMDYNKFFLKNQQELANHMLRARGYLFLNEVYHDLLGLKCSPAGQSVGWIYAPDEDEGDNFIDFGIAEVNRPNPDMSNGYEKVLLLDFNVDGDILDRATEKGLLE